MMAASSKKDKLIEEAQKCAARGQFDKAAKAYEQILALEPSAINLRQKLAELLVKCNRNDDARKELETVGKHFAKNGFYLKAIAVYKQLQKLFPADISISLTLAELNEKHGLVANALAEYKFVFEYHEKSGNRAEALVILDRMQHVDPQNIPIKIKMAEAFFQNDKKTEAYTVFVRLASLLLERGDQATLGKINSRVQQLYPGKAEFMLEILSEQVQQGNAASAIDGIQGLLRSNPNNKRAWDLVAQAYQLLGQPQRVKLAYQHYLKFFPTEPVAMLGLITAVTEEKNLAGTLELLERFETPLLTAGFFSQLEQIYLTLDKLDPINVKVLEGHIRVATAAGNSGEVITLSSKLASLRSVTKYAEQTVPGSDPADAPANFFAAPESPFDSAFTQEEPSIPPVTFEVQAHAPHELPSAFDEPGEAFAPLEEEADLDLDIEIDIDVDLDSPFDLSDNQTGNAAATENWLDSVGDLFDSISTAPRGVKFGNDMDSSDAQSHFDLGQAFKEMGLYDEAISEFRQAAQDPPRRIECMIMQCVCLRERGEVDNATTMLQALLKPGLTGEENCAVKYELATCYEMSGRKEDAATLLNEIKTTNPAFRDISSRLNAANLSETLDFSDDDLNDFGLD
jgi:tetratricopeptide (TPR) repeat protein